MLHTLHTLFSDVPVEQQETLAGGDSHFYCSFFNHRPKSKEGGEKLIKWLKEIHNPTILISTFDNIKNPAFKSVVWTNFFC